ncbi:hypothetical protein E4U17_000028 [Claviceps sp. LM77 group G4]|nr:hypothetical protein E4U17_000028 [Claviceps sp. LM77 group G4]KAG6085815.1 hypothetical protein E4U16_000028 [Claviceps sp. LM84 group G4]KAG6086517.1 hypothetical protein E4U33_004570 [Claviceps sp. LM78 group G4]
MELPNALPTLKDDDAGPDAGPDAESSADVSAEPSSDPSAEPPSDPSAAGDSRQKPFYSKRSHRKSRTGCQNCKSRKVKCDEEQPSCQTCLSRKEVCVYITPSQSMAIRLTTSSSASSQSLTSPTPLASQGSPTSRKESSHSTSDEVKSDQSHSGSVRSRRSHSVSRLGCQNCKSRKVKCDEERPSCRLCLLRKEDCVYIAPSSKKLLRWQASSVPSRRSRASRRSRTSRTESLYSYSDGTMSTMSDQPSLVPVAPVREPVATLPGCDAVDMRIIWHFMTNTCSSFSSGEGDSQEVMRVHVMKHALDVRFLLRSVLALSCLHARTCTGEQLGDAARHRSYQTESLQEYRIAIEAAEPRTFGALMANSLLVTVMSSEAFRDPAASDLYILQWMLVWRGIGVIFGRIHRSSLSGTGLTQLFHRPSMNLDEGVKYVPHYLTFMVMTIRPHDADYPYVATYLYGLMYLGSLYQHLEQDGLNSVMKLRIITWFTFLPSSMIGLFREKRERALVILAHYSVFLKITVSTWWLVGVGHRSIRDICNHLSPGWSKELEIPLRALSVDDSFELARLILNNPYWEPEYTSWSVFASSEEMEERERETRQLGLVDDEGRRIQISPEAGTVALAEPGEPGEEPVWNKDR